MEHIESNRWPSRMNGTLKKKIVPLWNDNLMEHIGVEIDDLLHAMQTL